MLRTALCLTALVPVACGSHDDGEPVQADGATAADATDDAARAEASDDCIVGQVCGDSNAAEVVVATDEAIRIELIWRSPGTPSEVGAPGPDLDLHVLHQDADGYFDPDDDVHWANPSPSWAGADAADDPNRGIEDIEGPGVEGFVLNLAELDHTYTAGVHYWDDHGLGAAIATLRVYVHGQLRFTWNDVSLDEGDLWDAVEIDWPSGAIRGIGGDTPQITTDYPVTVSKD